MDTFTIGYYIGRYTTRVGLYTVKATMAVHGYRKLSKIADAHKIVTRDPQAVTDNVFACLEYFDW
jgi:hypothetical protein